MRILSFFAVIFLCMHPIFATDNVGVQTPAKISRSAIHASGLGCRTFDPLRDEVGFLIQRVSHPGYTNDGTYLWPNGSTFIRRNYGYTNDMSFSYPNEATWMRRNSGYTNDKSMAWPSGSSLVTRNYGYTNDGTLGRADGSTWLQQWGYGRVTQYGPAFSEDLVETEDSVIYSRAFINGDYSISQDVIVIGNNYEIDVAFDPSFSSFDSTADALSVTECTGAGPYAASIPHSPSRISLRPIDESTLRVDITPRFVRGNGFYQYAITENEAPADCKNGTFTDSLQFLITGLKPGTIYGVRVCGVADGGLYTPGVAAGGRTLAHIPPAQPRVYQILNSSTSLIELDLSPGVGGSPTLRYRFAQGIVSCESATPIGLINDFVVNHLDPGREYTFTICAEDTAGYFSEPFAFSASTPGVAPMLSISMFRGRARISWSWPAVNALFDVQGKDDMGGTWKKLNANDVVSSSTTLPTSYIDFTAAPGHRFYRVLFKGYKN
jgi:hypothetical protein